MVSRYLLLFAFMGEGLAQCSVEFLIERDNRYVRKTYNLVIFPENLKKSLIRDVLSLVVYQINLEIFHLKYKVARVWG